MGALVLTCAPIILSFYELLNNLATMLRIMLKFYVNCYTFFEEPEKDWAKIFQDKESPPMELTLFN